jgi:hypothetical protein
LLDGPDLETLLGQVYSNYGEQARIVKAERVRTGGIGGFFSKERYEVAVEIEDVPVSLGDRWAMQVGTGPAEAHGEDMPLALILAEAMNQSVATVELTSNRSPQLSTSGPAFAGVLESLATVLGSDAPASLPEVPASTENLPPVVWTESAAPARWIEVASAQPVPSPTPPPLRPVVARIETEDEYLAKPPRPPRGHGQVLAVVGEAAVAFNAGLVLASRMRIPSTRVLLASSEPVVPGLIASRRLVDATAARKRSVGLLSATAPSVVAIELPIGAIWDDEAVDWAMDMVRAVGAITVWAVVDATRKSTDLSRWLARLDSVDALVVHNAAATDGLLSVRQLGFPVAVIDDRLATTAVWRSMLGVNDGVNS